jgi:uncharacterized protein YaiL (DUF2058 family)
MGSLQDALLNAGLADESQAKKPRRNRSGGARSHPSAAHKPPPGSKKSGKRRKASPASDLERAYKAREQAEKQEREDKKRARVEAQEARRKRNKALDSLVKGKTLNRKDAEIPRYFEHLGRIRRVLCTADQRDQLNRGELAVVNLRGSYLLIDLETLATYRDLAPDLVPDLTPKEPDDDGSHYPDVPDDLIW